MGKTALLLLDLQQGLLDQVKIDVPTYLSRVNRMTQAAQSTQTTLIYVRTSFRKGDPDISPNNAAFSRVTTSGSFTKEDASCNFPKGLALQFDDILVNNRRASVFTGSDLGVVLKVWV
ncbi:hypothetical protein DE146DRAFT_634969 [Phaeosphaeria sp. MPI-PUGE-AT-0046c]|nr:hypothetical protein DE146DRAFT_634969 [Phaeosphaeria sp. MPI-PUGE-AT-0046c]